jgi:arylformamidase
MAAMMLTAHGSEHGAVVPLQGAIALSGVFDLLPLVETSINRALGLDPANGHRLSPARRARQNAAPLYTLVGEEETAGFHMQRTLLSSQWRDVHHLAPVTARHHYTILDLFREPGNMWLESIIDILRGK